MKWLYFSIMWEIPQRHREAEWMDEPDVDPVALRKSLAFIRRVNVALGYTRATLSHLERFSRRWTPDRQITILDLATGSADIPRAILRWADRRGFDVRIVGIDRHATTAREAQACAADGRLRIVCADALDLPFADESFDYVLTAMFLHHLDDGQVTNVLKSMNRLARRGVIIADLLRDRRALLWIKLFTLLSNPMVRHDAAVSVGQAFSKAEAIAFRDRAGLGYCNYFAHFGHRFVLAGEKAS